MIFWRKVLHGIPLQYGERFAMLAAKHSGVFLGRLTNGFDGFHLCSTI